MDLSGVLGRFRTERFLVDWIGVEEAAGLRLPSDYKAYVEAYGPSDIGELRIVVPTARTMIPDPHILQGLYDAELAHGFWPAPGGLLLWGYTGNVSRLFWDTSAGDDPDRWPVVAEVVAGTSARRSWHEVALTMTEVIHGLVTGAVDIGLDIGDGRLAAVERDAADARPWRRGDPSPVAPVLAAAGFDEGWRRRIRVR
jgi:hypothetical protein